ncbi:MAG: phospholipase D-like domain-containing protein [Stellaceae bacterium]
MRRGSGRLLLLLLLFAGTQSLEGCAVVPRVRAWIEQPPGAAPNFHGSNGPLTAAQSRAVMVRLTARNHHATVLDRHVALETALADSPLYVGNKLTLLSNGRDAFSAMFAAIRAAKNNLDLEFYIFKNVESDGHRLLPLLLEKRREGVVVNIIYDSYGSGDASGTFLTSLRKAGVNFVDYNPFNPLLIWLFNDRDHRKILIADGKLAIIGGVNLDTVYTEPDTIVDPATGRKVPQFWNDADVEIQGPAVAALQRLFFAHWRDQNGRPVEPADYFPHLTAQGHEIVRIIGSSPRRTVPDYYVSLLSAMSNAEHNIWVTAAYFVPTKAELRDMMAAARRGDDVRLYLPGHSDGSTMALAVGRSHYTALLKAGVKIYEAPFNVTLHSKFVTIDGVWSVIGSSNFDHRSVIFNDEVDAVVLGRPFAKRLQQLFMKDIADDKRIRLRAWRKRPAIDDIGDNLARIWQSLL